MVLRSTARAVSEIERSSGRCLSGVAIIAVKSSATAPTAASTHFSTVREMRNAGFSMVLTSSRCLSSRRLGNDCADDGLERLGPVDQVGVHQAGQDGDGNVEAQPCEERRVLIGDDLL